MSQLRSIARRVVRVVVPAGSGADRVVRTAATQARHNGMGKAGVEKAQFGSVDLAQIKPGDDHTVTVDDKKYQLFFLCGHPRSGTHWTGGILNRHPKICVQGEYRFEGLRAGFDELTRHTWHAAHNEPMRSAAEGAFRDSVRRVIGASAALKPNAAWLGDRTPRALDVYVPGAPHFLIIRDPRDVLISWAHHEFKTAGYNYGLPRFKGALEPVREAFLRDPEHFAKRPGDLLEHEEWGRHLVGRWRHHMEYDLRMLKRIEAGEVNAKVYVIRYEKLHADIEGERARMYEFLGLDPSEAEPLSDFTKTTPGFGRDNPHAFFRKGETGDWQNYFTDKVKAWYKDAAGDLLVELGYEQGFGW